MHAVGPADLGLGTGQAVFDHRLDAGWVHRGRFHTGVWAAGGGFRCDRNPLCWLMTLKCGHAMVMEIRWHRNDSGAGPARAGSRTMTPRASDRPFIELP